MRGSVIRKLRNLRWAQFRYFAVVAILGLVGVGWMLFENQAGALVGTVRPNGDITVQWPACTGAGCTGAHYTAVDETSNSAADYVNTGLSGAGGEVEEYAMTSVAGAVDTVSQVAVTIYAHSVTCESTCDDLEINISIDGVLQTGQPCVMTTTNTACAKTFNGTWSGDGDLQVRVTRIVQGGGNPNNRDDDVRLTYVAADVTYTANSAPAAPTLSVPANSATGVSVMPTFQLRTTDADNDYLRYRVDVCSTSDCSSILRTIDQTASQTGWSGQDTQTNTAYIGSSTLTSSTIANHTYQAPALSYSTQYWWRGYAIDPGGSNALSATSAIQSFTTQALPAAPTLVSPVANATNASVMPTFQLRTTDADNDYLRYRVDVCSTSDCSSILRTIDQTASQTGWSGQDTQTNTAYIGSSTLTSSTIANHTYQAPALSYSTQYWWRGYAIDPGGTNTWSSTSVINSFTTQAAPLIDQTNIEGGVDIIGGTLIQ